MEAQTSMNGNAGAEPSQSSKRNTVAEIADLLGIEAEQLYRFRCLSGIPFAQGSAVLAYGLAQEHELSPSTMKEVYVMLGQDFTRMLEYFKELSTYGLDHSLENVVDYREKDSLETAAIQKLQEERGAFPDFFLEE